MNDKKPSPRAILCYVSDDDWLARGIADGIEEKEFFIHLTTWCVHSGSELWQKIRESTDKKTHFLVLLTTRSIERLWGKQDVNENEVYKLNKSLRLIPIVHGLSSDKAHQTLLEIDVYVVEETCDVAPLVEHIKKLNADPDQPPTSYDASDNFPEPSAAETDARLIARNYLPISSEFKVDITQVVEECKWDKTRLDSAISWLETRGLVKIEDKLIVGKRPRIDCLKHIIYKDTIRSGGMALMISLTRIDTLLLNREEFEGKIYNDGGSFYIQLTASADRSGKIVLDVEPTNSVETGEELLFAYSELVNLDCTSVQDKNRKLTSDNVRIRCDIYEKPVPICLETDKVVITDEDKETDLLAKNTTKTTLCLSEFDCLDSIYVMNFPSGKFVHNISDSPPPGPMEVTPAPYVEGLGYLTLESTLENSIKNRTNKRITATLSITAVSELENLTEWKKGVRNFLQRLITVLEFAQGGNLFCPITELCEGGKVENTFLLHGETALQFMPVIQRGEDLKNLIVKVIEKQKLGEDKWKGIKEAISFALSAPNYGESRLLLNLIAIEKLVKLFGEERRKKCNLVCKIEFYMRDRNIYFADIKYSDIKKLVDTRNELAHNGKFSGGKDDLAQLLALSHEVLTRIILNVFDFNGWYCSYTSEKGLRSFPECADVAESNVSTLNFLRPLYRWKDLAEQKDSRVPVHLPS